MGRAEWKTIDARLRALARRRAALDAEELALIRAAQRLSIAGSGWDRCASTSSACWGTRRETPASGCVAADRSMREIEAMVAGRQSGDRPDDDPDPSQVTYGVRFEVRGEAYALLRQAQQVIADRLGHQPTSADAGWAVLDRSKLLRPAP